MEKIVRRLVAVSLISVSAASSALAVPAPQQSWGKAGITLAQYRQDALECGLKGYYTDISQTDDAKALVKASNQLNAVTRGASGSMTTGSNATGPGADNSAQEAAEYARQQQHIVESVRPEERYKSIKKTLIANTEACLASRGYSRFVLTGDQRKLLHKLKVGSDERRAYLYSLASNPAVLQSQKTAEQP
jgi:hypothetical protein